MINVELKDIYLPKNILIWSLMAFKAGYLNAAGFLITGNFVSHITGFATQLGVAAGHADYDVSLKLLVIPLGFIGGSYITAHILDRPYSKGSVPNYPIVQFMITSLLGLTSLLFSLNIFKIESPPVYDWNSLLLMGVLCLTCGLKNGLSTWASHLKIRTTHLTGLATDIGLHLPKLFNREGWPSKYPEPKTVNHVRIITFLCYTVGATLSAMLIPEIGYQVFHISFFISAALTIVSIMDRRKTLASIRKQDTANVEAALT